jgi:hypothetical protein
LGAEAVDTIMSRQGTPRLRRESSNARGAPRKART